MANMKQQIKRYKNDNKKRAKNASYKSALKTAIKNVRAEVEAGNKEAAEKALVIASSKLDSYVNKGIHHKNYAIRQKSKPCTFLLAYGGYPEKLSKNAKIPLAKAQEIFDRYHNVLYSSITDMKDRTLEQAVTKGKVHLGLGCYMNTSEPESEIRTLFNALTIY